MSTENKSARWFRFQRKIAPYCFIFPGVFFYLLGTLLPMIIGITMSFTNWSIISRNYQWMGLANYQRLLEDEMFWLTLRNTFRYAIGLIPGVIILGFILALLLNTEVRGIVIFRIIYYLPVITPIAVASVIWLWIYDPRVGVLNWLLGMVGIGPNNWLKDPNTAMSSIVVMGIWLGAGSKMIIYLAALQGIPRSLYEAAEIDGADRIQKLRYLTLPLLRPTTLFIVVTTTMSALRVYTQVNIMTQGGPLSSTSTIVYYIFNTAFSDLRMGYAAALSVALFIITLILTFINWKFLGKDVYYG